MSGIRSALWRAATPMAKWSLTDCSVDTSSDTPRDRAAPRHIVTQPVSCHHASTAILPAARPVRFGSRHAVRAGILCEPARCGSRHIVGAGMPATGTNCGSRHAGDRHLSPRRQLQVLGRPQSLPWQLPQRGRDVDANQAIRGSQHIVGDRHVVGAGMPATATNCGSRHAGNSHKLWEPACRRQAPLTLPTASGAQQAPVAAMAAPTPRKGCRSQSSNLWEQACCRRPACCGSHHAGNSHQLWEPACRRQPPLTPPIASGARQTPVAAMAAPTAPPTATLNQSPASSICSAARGR